MLLDLPDKCPLLEDEKTTWGTPPYCVMIYTDLLADTLDDYCLSENYINCPIYIKAKKESTAERHSHIRE